ncbi:heterochromatin protein one [Biscogniauxia mediterranea]|nr:heterochromatin protein one [Biscogniauxia mediterranea]
MPPAISDDEKSDVGETDVAVPLPTRRARNASLNLKEADDVDDDDMPDIVKGDVGNGDDNAEEDKDEKDEDEDEDLEEDEFIVEKIISHAVEADGTIKYKVKWEGYEKKSDQTWEDEENLRENAAEVLGEYLASVGGRDKILEATKTALKTKKRGRPAAAGSTAGTPTNGTKRRRNGSHPASTSPPANARAWKPPVGSWEDEVESIEACHDERTGKLLVYLTWKNGHKTQHETKVIYQRCPQKMLQYYERHVKIVMSSTDGAKDE